MAWTNLYPIPEAQMKMRFKEPYVTEGLNAKTAVSLPRGIYRGFNLGTSPLDLTVVLKADEHSNDHVAVFESAAGLSLTVRVEGGDVSLDLSAFAEETVVLAIFCDYTRFETTEGAIRAYKLADFLAAPEKESLIVIGQVDVPELDPIPEADITYNRRIEAWQSKAPSAVNWAPLLTNGAFDRGPLGVIESPDIPGWYVTGHSGTTVVEPTLVSTHGAIGGRCFVFDVTSADAGDEVNLTFSTGCGVPVNPGSKIRFRCFKRVDKVPSSGSLSEVIPLSFRRADGSSIPGFPVALEIDFDAIDPDWVPVEVVTTIPDEAVELVGFSADWDNIFFDSTGPFINLDGFQIWVENREALEPYSFFDSGRRSLEGRNLYLTPNGNDFVRFAVVTRDGSYVAWSDVLAADKGIFGNVASDPSFPEGHAVRGYGTGSGFAGIYGEGVTANAYGVYGIARTEEGVAVYGWAEGDYGVGVKGEGACGAHGLSSQVSGIGLKGEAEGGYALQVVPQTGKPTTPAINGAIVYHGHELFVSVDGAWEKVPFVDLAWFAERVEADGATGLLFPFGIKTKGHGGIEGRPGIRAVGSAEQPGIEVSSDDEDVQAPFRIVPRSTTPTARVGPGGSFQAGPGDGNILYYAQGEQLITLEAQRLLVGPFEGSLSEFGNVVLRIGGEVDYMALDDGWITGITVRANKALDFDFAQPYPQVNGTWPGTGGHQVAEPIYTEAGLWHHIVKWDAAGTFGNAFWFDRGDRLNIELVDLEVTEETKFFAFLEIQYKGPLA